LGKLAVLLGLGERLINLPIPPSNGHAGHVLHGRFFCGTGISFPSGAYCSPERRRNVMLRITRMAESPTHVTLKLEGRIVSDWVSVVERECLTALQKQRQVVLDLSEVTFIDGRGLEMLRQIASPHLQIINASALIEDLLGHGGGERNTPEEGV
jgi:ABC-type transporter Mla MlaB component